LPLALSSNVVNAALSTNLSFNVRDITPVASREYGRLSSFDPIKPW
jgi:hypothetical protein